MLFRSEAGIASERYAWKLAQEAAHRSIRNLEGERNRLHRELQAAQQAYSNARAALEAGQQDKDAMRLDLAEARAELGHRMGELDILEERRIVVDSGVRSMTQTPVVSPKDLTIDMPAGRAPTSGGAAR